MQRGLFPRWRPLPKTRAPRWRRAVFVFEGVVDGRRGVAAHVRHPMAVGVERELDRGSKLSYML